MVTGRHGLIRNAYDSLGRGEMAPWVGLLDSRVVWRAMDRAEDAEAPT